MNNIIKIQLEERIRILCLKHRGNIEIISKESGVSPDYVRKIIAKIQRKQERDVSAIIGDSMAGYIIIGAEQRKSWLLEQLQEENAKKPVKLSCCHSKPVKTLVWDDEEKYVCTTCDKDCQVYEKDPRDHKLIIKLISELRSEDTALVDFVERLGFVNDGGKKDNTPTVNNYNIAMSGLSLDDQKVITEAEQLDPRTRESLRRNLERRITDAQFETENGQK